MTPACIASGADIVLTGTFDTEYYTRSLATGTAIDARNATFIHCSQPDPSDPCTLNIYPVNLGPVGGADACWGGGAVLGRNRLDASWAEMHDPNNAGFIFENRRFIVDGVRIDNVGDGIRPRAGAEDFVIRNAWLSYVRDDCVENDSMNAGVVDDSLFDGCYVGFSARNSDLTIVGSENVWTIQNTLVRLEPMPGSRESGTLGHKGFFKWTNWGDPSSPSPKLALYNNVFMAEQQGEVDPERMGIPPGKLAACANNVMVWLGPGDYPAALPSCFTVTRDRTVWDQAKADWIRRHSEGCSSDAECDDGNPCTVDTCEAGSGTCRAQRLPDGAACGPEAGICCAGACASVACSGAADCDDGDACTVDACLNAGTCAAACTSAPRACGLRDGCCAPGCTAGNDLDCPAAVCGDGICAGKGENCLSCPADCRCQGRGCVHACCGDGLCTGAERSKTCPVDCP